jgi:hypothetical protein
MRPLSRVSVVSSRASNAAARPETTFSTPSGRPWCVSGTQSIERLSCGSASPRWATAEPAAARLIIASPSAISSTAPSARVSLRASRQTRSITALSSSAEEAISV